MFVFVSAKPVSYAFDKELKFKSMADFVRSNTVLDTASNVKSKTSESMILYYIVLFSIHRYGYLDYIQILSGLTV